tara:strand:- start:835 stop:1377 length:543 start_codon:yes stop_codon:yes gene_type:complete
MKKKSYKSSPNLINPKGLGQEELPSVPAAEEGLSADGKLGSGWIFGEPVSPPTYKEEEEESELATQRRKSNNINKDDVMAMLAEIANINDTEGRVSEANFADFLIKKFAEQEDVDKGSSFKKLLMKIVDSDLVFYNEVVKDLTDYYNTRLSLGIQMGKSLEESRDMAFQKTEVKARRYEK